MVVEAAWIGAVRGVWHRLALRILWGVRHSHGLLKRYHLACVMRYRRVYWVRARRTAVYRVAVVPIIKIEDEASASPDLAEQGTLL